ncbi:uncharacterized protein [Montipora capricornis]|uniref:uncharacterized protein n=1 Tax=Montipora capricornis TaxID=246305 RepID=UPI0035F14B9F
MELTLEHTNDNKLFKFIFLFYFIFSVKESGSASKVKESGSASKVKESGSASKVESRSASKAKESGSPSKVEESESSSEGTALAYSRWQLDFNAQTYKKARNEVMSVPKQAKAAYFSKLFTEVKQN